MILERATQVATSADGRTLAVAGSEGRFVVWNSPAPLAGSLENIRLWVEVLAGMELDDRGVVNTLGPEAVRRRQEQLEERGGPPPIPGLPETR